MKNVREILQSYCIIIIGLIDATLLLRFFLNFYGVDENEKFIKIIFSLSSIFYGPFKGSFERVYTSDTMITDFSIIVGVVAYTLFALIFLSAIKIFFRWDVRNKISAWLGVFFKTFILLNIFRFVLTLLNASESTFTEILRTTTAFTVFPIKAMIPSAQDETVDLGVSIGISIVLLSLIWYTVDRILKSSIEKQTIFDAEDSKRQEEVVEESVVEEKIIEKNEEVEDSSDRPLVYVPLSKQQVPQTSLPISQVPQTVQAQQRTIPEHPFRQQDQSQKQTPPIVVQKEFQTVQPEQIQDSSASQPSKIVTQQNIVEQSSRNDSTDQSKKDENGNQDTQEESKTIQPQEQGSEGKVEKIKSIVKQMTKKEEKPFNEGTRKQSVSETPKSPLS